MKLIINTHFDIFIYHFYFRSQKFRKSFKEIKTLRTFMPNAVRLGLSGTITENDKNALCRSLGFTSWWPRLGSSLEGNQTLRALLLTWKSTYMGSAT